MYNQTTKSVIALHIDNQVKVKKFLKEKTL